MAGNLIRRRDPEEGGQAFVAVLCTPLPHDAYCSYLPLSIRGEQQAAHLSTMASRPVLGYFCASGKSCFCTGACASGGIMRIGALILPSTACNGAVLGFRPMVRCAAPCLNDRCAFLFSDGAENRMPARCQRARCAQCRKQEVACLRALHCVSLPEQLNQALQRCRQRGWMSVGRQSRRSQATGKAARRRRFAFGSRSQGVLPVRMMRSTDAKLFCMR